MNSANSNQLKDETVTRILNRTRRSIRCSGNVARTVGMEPAVIIADDDESEIQTAKPSIRSQCGFISQTFVAIVLFCIFCLGPLGMAEAAVALTELVSNTIEPAVIVTTSSSHSYICAVHTGIGYIELGPVTLLLMLLAPLVIYKASTRNSD